MSALPPHGSPVPPPLPTAALNYRGGPGGIDGAAWHALGRLCTCDNAILPQRCIKCNRQDDVRMKRKQFTWAPPIVYLGLLGGLLPCIILLLVLQKKSSLTYGLCATHRRKRLNNVWISLSIFGLAIACFVAAAVLEMAALVVLGFLAILGMLIFIAVAGPVLKPQRIDKGIAEFKGCGTDFLAALPNSQWE